MRSSPFFVQLLKNTQKLKKNTNFAVQRKLKDGNHFTSLRAYAQGFGTSQKIDYQAKANLAAGFGRPVGTKLSIDYC